LSSQGPHEKEKQDGSHDWFMQKTEFVSE
jgi:hypothetical protein